jgi:pimeloyl-ACP methyl ester carboxylesterase
MALYEKKYVQLQNEKLAYIEVGSGNKVIVLIHGNFTSSFSLYPFFERCPKNARMIAFDLRGFGDSSYNNRFDTIDELADDVIEAIKVLGLKNINLVGWSLGGAVCLKIAAKLGCSVDSMSLIQSASYRGFPVFQKDSKYRDIYGKVYPNKDAMALDPILVLPLLQAYAQNDRAFLDAIKMASTWSKNRPSKEICDEYIDEQLKQRCLVDADWALANFNMSNSSNMYNLGTNDINNITCKTFMTNATGDAVVTSKMTIENMKALKNLTVKVYEGEGHQVLFDRPDEVTSDIYSFIGL